MKNYRIVVDLKPTHSFSYQWRIELCTQDGIYTVTNGQASSVAVANHDASQKAKKLGLI